MADLSRRRFLRYAAGAAAAVGAGYRAYEEASGVIDRDCDGLSEADEDAFLERYVSEVYGEDVSLDPSAKTLIIDARYVEGTSFGESGKEDVVELFADNGIDLVWLDYPRRYDRGSFLEAYGNEVDPVLGGEDSFYDRAVDEVMKEHALQMVFVPGRDEERDGPPGAIYHEERDAFFSGYSLGDRAMVTTFFDEGSTLSTVVHEIGHLALEHDYDDEENHGLMGQKEELDFTEEEWEEIRSQLSDVNGPVPDTVCV